MFAFVMRRLAQGVVSLVALTLIVFLSAHITGDPAKYLLSPEASTQADYERLKQVLGLDRSLPEQYWLFIQHAVQGNFGTSFQYHRPVLDLIQERLPGTLQLAAAAMLLSLPLGVALGVVAALKPGSLLDRGVTLGAVLGMSAPQFWVAILLITVFAGNLQWLPAFGKSGPASLVLPTITLSLYLIAVFMRLVRSSMLETLRSGYVRFARLRGLSERRVIWKHALKNALIPVITFAGITLGALLNGTIVVEQVFAWPGVGRLMLGAVTSRDFPVLQGAVLFAGTFYIVSSLLVDLIYASVDPRIRLGSKR
jgi:peptide/nickel transport system permease protein